nr:hypothetical protein [Paraburkholderia hospita]
MNAAPVVTHARFNIFPDEGVSRLKPIGVAVGQAESDLRCAVRAWWTSCNRRIKSSALGASWRSSTLISAKTDV